jgi:transcriptional regulator with GAF, ATPase, and Fis domain
VNLSALSANLIESELFGHRRGAFTGAVADHAGWLETCTDCGTVFLDEIAELDPPLQVKLLRVLQSRRFQRVGETREREFTGKIIAATNRDLVEERSAGRFRSDLYYRLCADVIRTPTLREQLADSPEDLAHLVELLCTRIVGEAETATLRREVLSWIEKALGASYTWPGNVRELEQCVRNVLVRGEYHPEPVRSSGDLGSELERGELSAEDLLRRYCTLVYARTGSYEEAARRLGLDRRTVKAKVDLELLARMRE